MNETLAKMLARVGKTPSDLSRNSKVGKLFRRDGVPDSKELQRILNIPRRVLNDKDEQLAVEVSEFFKTPEGTMTLRPIQAVAIQEMHDFGGFFGMLRVGSGKTLLTLLAPTVLNAERTLLLIPAKLRAKTYFDLAALAPHWQIDPSKIRIESYEMLSRAGDPFECEARGCVCKKYVEDKNDPNGRCSCLHDYNDHALPSLIDEYGPDLIVADEGHRLRNIRAACVRKVRRYATRHPQTRFVIVSGTITKRSLRDYVHLLHWCFPRHAPLPDSWKEVVDWSYALDERVDPLVRLAPGALSAFMDDSEKLLAADREYEVAAARSAYRRRLVETPGVVATTDKFVDSSISIEVVTDIDMNDDIESAFSNMRENWVTPDGHPIADPSAMWRHARELACGFYYRWTERPSEAWLKARAEWAKFVRETIRYNKDGLDSELQVSRFHQREPKLLAWQAIRDTFKPKTEAVWLDDAVMKRAVKWLKTRRGIVWVEHKAVGQKLSELTGFSFFSDGGCDAAGLPIEQANTLHPLIASITSNGEGRNLQAWCENLIVSMPPTGIVAEQLMGRTHREMQESDEVTFEIYAFCTEAWDGIAQAKNDARYLHQSTGQEQKLLYADWIAPDEREINSYESVRWQRKEQ